MIAFSKVKLIDVNLLSDMYHFIVTVLLFAIHMFYKVYKGIPEDPSFWFLR